MRIEEIQWNKTDSLAELLRCPRDSLTFVIRLIIISGRVHPV